MVIETAEFKIAAISGSAYYSPVIIIHKGLPDPLVIQFKNPRYSIQVFIRRTGGFIGPAIFSDNLIFLLPAR
jgi:hypothetical protein